MAVKIRMRRIGRRGIPVYQIIAADSQAPRNGKFLEKLGWFNPRKKLVTLDIKNTENWLKKGATMSERVRSLYNMLKKQKEVNENEGTD